MNQKTAKQLKRDTFNALNVENEEYTRREVIGTFARRDFKAMYRSRKRNFRQRRISKGTDVISYTHPRNKK